MPGNPPSWRDSVVYQLYVRSFADADGDGVGDLDGITEHLDYIESLCVYVIWLTPLPLTEPRRRLRRRLITPPSIPVWRKPPSIDFSTQRMRADCASSWIWFRMIARSAHPWFQKVVRPAPGSAARSVSLPKRARIDGGEPPNNWRSSFGGPAWSR